MKKILLTALLLCLPAVANCGFGLDDDHGTPTPAATYWGWKCADGRPPDPDAGCLPASCDGGGDPSDVDGGEACLCADGTAVLSCACEQGGCGGGGD